MSTIVTEAVQYNTARFTKFLQQLRQNKKRRREEEIKHPFDSMALVKKYKIGALRVPKEQGGGGATITQLFEAIIDIAAADSDVAHILRSHYGQVENYLLQLPSENKTYWLNRVAEGAILGNAYTEISKQSVGKYEFQTELKKEQNTFTLNGTKYYSTGTLYADYIFVTATYEQQPVAVVVPAKRQGVRIIDDWDGIGQKYTGSGTTIFENVYVEAQAFTPIDREAVAFNTPLQLILTAVIAGIVQEIVSDAKEIVTSRVRSFTFATHAVPTQDAQLQQTIGKIATQAFVTKSTVLTAAHALQKVIDSANGLQLKRQDVHEAALQAAHAKIIVDDLASQAANLLFEVGGSSTVRTSKYYEQHWLNIRTVASHNPSAYKERVIGDYILNNQQLPIEEIYF